MRGGKRESGRLPRSLDARAGRALRYSLLLAGVAELADAQDSGSCVRKDVEVQVLSPALRRKTPGRPGVVLFPLAVASVHAVLYRISSRSAISLTIAAVRFTMSPTA